MEHLIERHNLLTASHMSRWHLRANPGDLSRPPQEPLGTLRVDVVGCDVHRSLPSGHTAQWALPAPGGLPHHAARHQSTSGEAYVTSAPHRINDGSRRSRVPLTAAGLGVAIVMVAGCGGSADTSPSSSPSAPATASSPTADPQAAAKATVLAVYRKMWAAQVRAYASGTLKGAGLETYAGDKALSKIKVTALYYQQHGSVMKGEPTLSPKVTAINTSTQPYSATITDCVDTTNYVQVDKKTGKPVGTLDSNRRHVTTFKANPIAGKWRITDFDIARDRTC
jgi:hypothetical protein